LIALRRSGVRVEVNFPPSLASTALCFNFSVACRSPLP
jgi:hypothetical protein